MNLELTVSYSLEWLEFDDSVHQKRDVIVGIVDSPSKIPKVLRAVGVLFDTLYPTFSCTDFRVSTRKVEALAETEPDPSHLIVTKILKHIQKL